ncbi:glycosyltransferase family 2 protein, partial [Helicobacter rodentium]
MNPKVSIVIPSLNSIRYIEECLQSVLNQTLQEIEILCVDANSTDGTLEYLK